MYSEELYSAYQKRKSFHVFMAPKALDAEVRKEVEEKLNDLVPLYPEIKTKVVLVDKKEVSSTSGAPHYVLFYSEKKDGYLENIGYMGEQLDVWCASRNIGGVWLGLGKTDAVCVDGLDYVIMIGIGPAKEEKFRLDRSKAKRKDMATIWSGETMLFSEDARFAPSACNSQPWSVENKDNILSIYRNWNSKERVGLMTPPHAAYFNRIDMGIFLYCMELSMMHFGIEATRVSYPDKDWTSEKVLVAEYGIK